MIWGLQVMGALVGTLITRSFFRFFLTRRENVPEWAEYVLWGGCFAGGILIGHAELELSPLLLLAGWGGICLLLYGGRLKKKLLVILGYFACAVVAAGGMSLLLGQPGELTDRLRIFCWAFGKVTAVTVLQSIKGIREKAEGRGNARNGLLACFLINSGTILMLLNLLLLTRDLEGEAAALIYAFSIVLLLVLNVLCFALYGNLREKDELVEEQSLVHEQQRVLFDVQNEETEETWNELKKFRHDYANHLICIREYLKKQKGEEALEYVNGLLDGFKGEYGTKKISNSFVDTFLGYKIRNGNPDKICFHTDIVIPRELPFAETDLCIILGNAFDNAAEAVHGLPEKEQWINISITYKRHTLKILVENPYNGGIRTDRRGRLLTTRQDGAGHGIGISSMEKTVKKYDGLLDVSYTKDVFRLKALLYEKQQTGQGQGKTDIFDI